jgi:hypothetical protein
MFVVLGVERAIPGAAEIAPACHKAAREQASRRHEPGQQRRPAPLILNPNIIASRSEQAEE